MRRFAICLIYTLGWGSAVAQSLTPEQQEVWAGEEAYWAYVGKHDVEGFMTLWHERFIGWPCDASTTENYAELRAVVEDWFADVAAEGNTTKIDAEGVIVDNDFAITYVAATTTGQDEAGAENDVSMKIVHTWRRTDDGWKIIGGMCGPLERSDN